MNNAQKNILITGLFLLLGAVSYAPWISTIQPRGLSQIINPAGYHFIFFPPSAVDLPDAQGVIIDFKLYLIQILFVVILVGVLFFVFGSQKKD